jgi:hypothetical protein
VKDEFLLNCYQAFQTTLQSLASSECPDFTTENYVLSVNDGIVFLLATSSILFGGGLVWQKNGFML